MTIQAEMALLAAGSYWDIRRGALNLTTGIDTGNDAPLPEGWVVVPGYDTSESGANAGSGADVQVSNDGTWRIAA